MCVVIDTDTFSEISDDDNKDFDPLRNWISKKGHTVIHGGSKYGEELGNHDKFRRYLRGLERAGHTHQLDNAKVDNAQVFLEQNFVSAKYNDHHIVAILFVSRCRVLSSHDQGLHKLIQDCCSNSGRKIIRQVATLTVNIPKIYQDKSHKPFLMDNSVAHCCI